jgi:hypothetical protein
MVGDPSLCEAVELVELRLGIVFRIVAHINPVKHELLDLVAGKVRVQFMDTLDGLLKIEPFCVRPISWRCLASCTSSSKSTGHRVPLCIACPCRRTGYHPRVKPEGMLRRDMRQAKGLHAFWFPKA